ncbi:MAG: permease [Mycobacterium sp.]
MTVALARRLGSMELLIATLVVFALTGELIRGLVVGSPDLSTAATIFCGVFVQAVPFLVLGVLVSGLVAVFVTPERLARWLPRRTGVAVVAAGLGGAALPGCECGSVPVARRLFGEGASGAAALTFLLSAPAINPVVLVATAVAFPGQPGMVVARASASLSTAVVMGLAWSRWGRLDWVTRRLPRSHDADASRWTVFTEAARHDFLQAAPYLVLGAAAAAALHVLVPAWVFEHLAGNLALGILVMALLAVVLALCSEADAFVAASLTMLPLLPRLVFLVVGPAVDVKLFAMQAGSFGRAFAVRFAPATFVVATLTAAGVGYVVLGGAG